MKKFVVALISFFENEIKQFKIEAESDYDAVKKTLVEFAGEHKGGEIEFQNSADYPKNIEALDDHLNNCEMGFSVIEVKDF